MRSTASSRAEPAHAKVPAKPIELINNSDIIFFMNLFLLGFCGTKRRRLQMG
jgi:hypothetical protein